MALDPGLRTVLALAALALAVILLYFLLVGYAKAFQAVGFTPGEASLIIFGSLAGAFVNVPLFEANGWRLHVNVGGALVPLLVCLWLFARRRVPVNEALVGVVLVTAITYLITDFDPALGIVAPFPLWLLPSFAAAAVSAIAFWHDRAHAAGLAYVCGTLGALIGADLLRLPDILAAEPLDENRLSMGGAAVFDMVFLTGILAIGYDALLVSRRRAERLEGPGGDIDRELQAWLASKKQRAPPRERARDRDTRYVQARALEATPTSPFERIPFKRRGEE